VASGVPISQERPGFFWLALGLGAVFVGLYGFALSLILRYRTVSTGADAQWIFPLLLVSVAYCAMGMLMGLVRPEQGITRLGCISGLVIALHMLGQALGFFRNTIVGAESVVLAALNSVVPWHLIAGYHFFSRFPDASSESRRWIVLRIGIVVYGLAIFVPRLLLNILRLLERRDLPGPIPVEPDWLAAYERNADWFEALFLLITVVSICAVLARNYRNVTDPGQFLRLRWVAWGAAVGLFPVLVYALGTFLLFAAGNRALAQDSRLWTVRVCVNLFACIIPVTLGYAVVRHRLLGINVVVRRGVQYLFAKNVLRLVLLVPILVIAFSVISNPHRTIAQVLFRNSIYFYVFLTITAALSLRFRKQLTSWVDRRFFREAYDSEQILLGLIERVKSAESVPEVSRLVTTELETALHPACVYVFYRPEGSPEMKLSSSSANLVRDLVMPPGFTILKSMQDLPVLQDIPGCAGQWPAAEVEWFGRLNIRLIVPMVDAVNTLTGLLLLGGKQSEQDYSATDRGLLRAIAGQIGVVLENLRLRDRVNRELLIRKDVLARLEGPAMELVRECPACGGCYDGGAAVCALDGTELTLTLPVERTIDGKYRLERLLGKGGTGAVYEASDLRLHRRVAVKIMVGSLFGDDIALRRFELEARSSARLAHPHIVTIHDFGTLRGGGAYLVMELLRGTTWRSELRRCWTIPPEQLAEWVSQLCAGVEAAHRVGVVHRDLKPENALITSSQGKDHLKVLDFGLAKLRFMEKGRLDNLTVPGSILGTLGYISPEQFISGLADERSDIFSIGVMTVESLTGELPFRGATLAEMLRGVLNDTFHLQGEGERVTALDRVLQRCLAKDPKSRFESVSRLRDELVPAIRFCPALNYPPKPWRDAANVSTRKAGA